MALVSRAITLELDTLKKRALLLPLQDDANEANEYVDEMCLLVC
jgi:hypothetical protein